MSRRRFTVLMLSLLFLAALAVAYFSGVFTLFLKPVQIAIVDTGIDLKNPEISAALSKVVGKNLAEGTNDVQDTDGHGTKVALEIVRACPRCRLIPIKISKAGLAITPEIVANAIEYAVKNDVRIINFSFGVNQSSAELEKAVETAHKNDVVLVAAAGGGVPNPFRPVELSQIYPQAFPQMIVVGSAKSLDEPDLMMNFGDRLDVVVTGQPEDQFGSSFGAARVSGAIGALLTTSTTLSPNGIRQRLRETSQPPKMKAGIGIDAALSRLGFGAFSGEDFYNQDAHRTSYRFFADDLGKLWVEVSADISVTEASVELKCTNRVREANSPLHSEVKVFPKARVRVSFLKAELQGLDKKCDVRLKLGHPDGSVRVTELDFTSALN